MAKKAKKARGQSADVAPDARIADLFGKLTQDTRKKVETLRTTFGQYAESLRLAFQKREELVGPVMKLYGLCMSEIPNLSYVQFMGMLDPSIPINQRDDKTVDGRMVKGYRSHPTYVAGEYVRRLALQNQRGTRAEGATGQARRGPNATERLSRLLATMVPLVKDADAFWAAVGGELQIDVNALAKLRRMTDSTEPLLRLPALTQAKRFPVRVLHVVPAAGEAQAAAA